MRNRTSLVVGLLAGLVAARAADPAKRPNIVLILGEAQGWASMSEPQDDRHPEGSRSAFIQTPHLDALARRGARFSDFYAASPRCTPTRAALVTGRNPAALGMTFVHEGSRDREPTPRDLLLAPPFQTELPAGIPTVAGGLRAQGYATAHFGKWHLGRANPREHGFEENDGPNSNGGPDNVEDPNPKQCHAIADLGIAFFTRQAKTGKPFFLQLSEYPSRGEGAASPARRAAAGERLGPGVDARQVALAAATEEVDASLGRVFQALETQGLLANTYVVYTADHGAQGRDANGMLTQGKGSVREGGLRVPLLVAGPGIAPGQFRHERASTVDLAPTLADWAGIPIAARPGNLDGVSLAPLLAGARVESSSFNLRDLVVHFPHMDKDPDGPASALLRGPYKFIRFYASNITRLYDVQADPGERRELSAEHAEDTAKLGAALEAYLDRVGAGRPTRNPQAATPADGKVTPPSPAGKPRGRGRGKEERSP